MTRVVPFFATLLFALTIGLVLLRPATELQASFELSELEFAVRQPDGSELAAHFLVRASSEEDALQTALATVRDFYPGATIREVAHDHDDDGHHDEHLHDDDGDGVEGVRAQWAPWGWQWDEDELPVPVHYNPENAPAFFSTDDVTQALEIWSSVPASSFAFEYAGETTAPASMNITGEPDGQNVIAWHDLGCDVGCVLGLTTKSFDTHEVDIALNTHPGANLGDGANDTYDVLTVLLHELGHMAGLEHSCPAFGPCTADERDAVMFYSYSGVRHELGEDDISGISALYPSSGGVTSSVPIEEQPGGTPQPAPSIDSPSDSSAVVRLEAGWNLTVLPGGAPEELAASLSCVDSIYLYDNADGWSHWIRDVYPTLQTIEEINPSLAYWVYASNSCQVFFR